MKSILILFCVVLCVRCNTPPTKQKPIEQSKSTVDKSNSPALYVESRLKPGVSYEPQPMYEPSMPEVPEQKVRAFTPENFADIFFTELEFRLVRQGFFLTKPIREATRKDMSKPLYAFFRKFRREIERNSINRQIQRDGLLDQDFGDFAGVLRRAVGSFFAELLKNAQRGAFSSLDSIGSFEKWITLKSILVSLTATAILGIASATGNLKIKGGFRLGRLAYVHQKAGNFMTWLLGFKDKDGALVNQKLYDALNNIEFKFEIDDPVSDLQLEGALNYNITDWVVIGLYGRYNANPDDSEPFSVEDIYDNSTFSGGIQAELSMPLPR